MDAVADEETLISWHKYTIVFNTCKIIIKKANGSLHSLLTTNQNIGAKNNKKNAEINYFSAVGDLLYKLLGEGSCFTIKNLNIFGVIYRLIDQLPLFCFVSGTSLTGKIVS